MMNRRALVGGAVVFGATIFAGGAFAADLPEFVAPPPAYSPPAVVVALGDWSGPYVGFHIGATLDLDRRLRTDAESEVSTEILVPEVPGEPGDPGDLGEPGGEEQGFCLNIRSNSPASPALDTREKCEDKGGGNPPHLWIVTSPGTPGTPGAPGTPGTPGIPAQVLSVFDTDSSSHRDSEDDWQLAGGFQLGYNWQRGFYVFGVETDFTFVDRDTLRSSSSAFVNGADIDVKASSKAGVDWFGTLRARVGYAAWDNLLPFITGGLAYGKVSTKGSVKYSGSLGGDSFSETANFGDSDVEVGWTVGAGLDYRIPRAIANRDVIVNFTYLYVDLDSHSAGHSFADRIGDEFAVAGSASAETDANFHTFRLGVSGKF